MKICGYFPPIHQSYMSLNVSQLLYICLYQLKHCILFYFVDSISDYYKKWLKSKPAVLDEKPKKNQKDDFDTTDEEWLKILEEESEEERQKRRLTTMTRMVRHLGGLLGDKATNMYRSAKGRSLQGIDSDDEERSVL